MVPRVYPGGPQPPSFSFRSRFASTPLTDKIIADIERGDPHGAVRRPSYGVLRCPQLPLTINW